MASILVCVECGDEFLADGDENLLCRNCHEKIMRELKPNGFPKHREFAARGRERQMVWREPKE
jgi:DNA-directed RNA polymerase subunit RPC12/RpoP